MHLGYNSFEEPVHSFILTNPKDTEALLRNQSLLYLSDIMFDMACTDL